MPTLHQFSALLASYLLHITYSQCIWSTTDANGQPVLLDLSCLSGMTLNDTDDANHDYLWTVCRNGETCNGEATMVQQMGETGCFNIGGWDADSLPEYEDVNGGSWTFRYLGATDCGNPARTWAPTFQCSPGTYYELSTVSEIPGSCYYEIFIKTQYACLNNKYSCTTTQIPGGDCLWNIGNDMLNLTTFKNQTLVAIDDKNSSSIVAFAPCSNALTCNNKKVSSKRVDVIDNKCIDYLSVWENGLNEPKYDPSTKTWQFIYMNGEECDGLQNVFEVYWQCDYQTKNTAKVVSFQEIDVCTFAMHINSSYACP